jgi:hypothetical protein
MSTDTWMGLSRDGSKLQISHTALMDWAYKNDKQFTVGWSHRFTDSNGNRLVRGDYVEEAKAAGWNDLAEMLESHFSAKASSPHPALTQPQTNRHTGG